MLNNLGERCNKILRFLLKATDYISMRELADKTNVSRRSVYYDICNINDWLDSHNLPALKILRGKGIFIPPDEKISIDALADEKDDRNEYIFLPSERAKIIACYIIRSKTPVYVEQLMDACLVSRNTIFADIQILIRQLHEYNAKLSYAPKTGYKITGDVIHVRALYFLFFDSLRILLEHGQLSFFNREEINFYFRRLTELKAELKIDYVEGNLYSLAALLPIMKDSTDELKFVGLKREKIFASREFSAVQKFFPELREDEQIYLSLHLLGSRLSVSTDKIFEDKSDQSIYGIVKTLVSEFEKTACVFFAERDELERALFIHIRSSLYRFRYGIQLGNPMREDIVREYPNLFNITKSVTKYLEQMLGLPVTDSEVAYLTLHFGAFMKIAEKKNPQLRILIVCVNGVSTGNMLRHEIEKLLPEAKIVGLVAAIDAFRAQEMCDLIISTAPIKSIVPAIVVHPILTDDDRKYILNHQLVRHFWSGGLADSLFESIRKYVDKKNYDAVKKEIQLCLQGSHDTIDFAGEFQPGILDCLTVDKISVTDEKLTWTDAIYFAGETLIRDGSIVEKYLDAIISQSMYYGAGYMFMNDYVMLAHAKPQDGVNRLNLSLTVFKTPVVFNETRAAKIIFMLCAEDNERHLQILNDLLTLATTEKNFERLAATNSADEILSILKEILQ